MLQIIKNDGTQTKVGSTLILSVHSYVFKLNFDLFSVR